MGDEEASDARQLRQGRDFFEATREAMTLRFVSFQPVTFACDTIRYEGTCQGLHGLSLQHSKRNDLSFFI
jgi:hypothetical protein